NMSEVWRKEITDMPRGTETEAVIQIQDKVYFFYEFWNRETLTEHLYYRVINTADGSLSEEVLLIESDVKIMKSEDDIDGGWWTTGVTFQKWPKDKFNFFYSFDSSKIMVK